MDKVELEFEFALNSPEAKAEAEQVKKSITGVGDTAEQQAKRVQDAVNRMINAPINQGNTSQFKLQSQLEAAKNAAFTEKNTSKLVEYNRTIERTEAEINRLKNAGKSGFDELGNAIGKSTNAAGKAFSSLRFIANILPGVGIAGVLAFAIEPITTYLASLNLFNQKIAEAIRMKALLTEVTLKGAQNSTSEITNLKLQYKATSDANVPLADRKDIYAQMQKDYPAYFANISFEHSQTAQAKKAYEELTGAILATAKARAYSDRITQNTNRDLDNEIKVKNLETELTKLEARKATAQTRALDEAATSTKEGAGIGSLSKANDLQGQINDKLKEKNNILTDSKMLNKQSAELEKRAMEQIAKGGKLTGSVGGNAVKGKSDDAMLNDQRNLQKRIEDINSEYNRKSLTKDEEELQAVRDKFLKISAEVKKFNEDPKNKYKVDGSGLDATKEKAISDLTFRQDTEKLKVSLNAQKKLYADYEIYKSTFGEAKAKERFTSEVKTNAELLKQLESDNQKLDLKIKSGDITAPEKERFESNKKEIIDLQNLEDKRYVAAYESALTTAQKIERINEEYRGKAKELGENITDEQKNNLLKLRDDAVNTAKDEALQKTEIYKKLSEETIELTKKQVKEQAAILKGLIADGSITGDAKTEIENQLNKLEFFLKVGVNQSNLDELKRKLSGLKDRLKLGSDLISPEEIKRTIKQISEVELKIKNITNVASGKAKSNFAKGLADNFSYLKGSAEDVAKGVSKDLGQVSGAFGDLSNAFGGVNTAAGYTLGTIGELASVGSDAAGAFASFASGDIIGGITGAISAVTGLFSIGKRVKEMNAAAQKEVADYYANAISGEREYQDLLKQRALQNIRDNKTTLQGIRDEVALRKSQIEAYNKEASEIMDKVNASSVKNVKNQFGLILQQVQGLSYVASETYKHGTWFRKAQVNKTYGSLSGMDFEQLSQLLAQGKLEGEAKALVERLKELEQKGYDAEQALADLARQTSEIFTGTTADTLTNSLLDMFKSGETGAQDLADFFKETMDDAALSIFRNKVLSDVMMKFYDEFDKAAQSDEEITDSEAATFQAFFTSLTDDAKTKFEALKKISGSDLGTSKGDGASSNNVKSGIQGMSQQTAEVIAGQFGGQRIATLEGNEIARNNGLTAMEQLAILKDNALMLVKIADNTSRSAEAEENYLPYLKSIDSKLTNNNNNNALRATGN